MANAANIEVFGMHTASDELKQLKHQLQMLELNTSRPENEDRREHGPRSDTELIATKLALDFEEYTLDLKLRTHKFHEVLAAERQALFSQQDDGRQRISASEEELRSGLNVLKASDIAVQRQREKRRAFNESRSRELDEWRDQAARLNALDTDFTNNDKTRMHALIKLDEQERLEAEAMYKKRMSAERQLLFMDEEDFLSQQIVLDRMNLVRMAPR